MCTCVYTCGHTRFREKPRNTDHRGNLEKKRGKNNNRGKKTRTEIEACLQRRTLDEIAPVSLDIYVNL